MSNETPRAGEAAHDLTQDERGTLEFLFSSGYVPFDDKNLKSLESKGLIENFGSTGGDRWLLTDVGRKTAYEAIEEDRKAPWVNCGEKFTAKHGESCICDLRKGHENRGRYSHAGHEEIADSIEVKAVIWRHSYDWYDKLSNVDLIKRQKVPDSVKETMTKITQHPIFFFRFYPYVWAEPSNWGYTIRVDLMGQLSLDFDAVDCALIGLAELGLQFQKIESYQQRIAIIATGRLDSHGKLVKGDSGITYSLRNSRIAPLIADMRQGNSEKTAEAIRKIQEPKMGGV